MPAFDGEYGGDVNVPVKFGNMYLVHVQGVLASGAIVATTALCSPGCTITGGAGGLMTVTFPGGQFVVPLGPPVVARADSGGEIGTIRVITPSSSGTGSVTLEFWVSNTAGTAAVPPDGSTVYFSCLVGAF